ncbi:MAG TPA: hypothetical protein PLT26_12855 [Anaerolineaceae bacterium]|nr:hypothetical protein [Anaerolineaceae bacterium]
MTRRSAFDAPLSTPDAGSDLVGPLTESTPGLLSYLPSPEQKKKRQRTWEKQNKPKHYRGVPADIRNAVKEIALDLNVTVDDVARAFFEYSLGCISLGTLRLDAHINRKPKAQKMTLFPFTGAGWAIKGWNPTPPAAPASPRNQGKKTTKAAWEEMVHYRIPDGLHEQIKSTAGMHFPVGEVAAVLLKHGVEAYRAGILVFTPQPRIPIVMRWSSGR